MKATSTITLLFIILISCNKDEVEYKIPYPSSYHKSDISKVGDLRLFSSQGEIKDAQLIKRFKDMDDQQFENVEESIRNNHYFMDSVRIEDGQNGTVSHLNSLHYCTYTRQGEKVILTSSDTLELRSTGEVVTRTLEYNFGEVKPEVYDEYLISSVRGFYIFGYTGRERFVLKESGGNLVAPALFYVSHKAQSSTSGYTNNLLQNDFYTWMPVGDTISIREYVILYDK